MTSKNINFSEIVGRGYATINKFKGRYKVVKGGRASKKSKYFALEDVMEVMETDGVNILVCRRWGTSLKQSCYADIVWAINRLGVQEYWKLTVSPLEATYKPTGQKILFKGLDKATKIKSIAVNYGVINKLRIEEAYELDSVEEFEVLDKSIRGESPMFPNIKNQVVLHFNPELQDHWLYDRFFADGEPDDEKILEEKGMQIHVNNNRVLSVTTNFKLNEYLTDDDRQLFRDMQRERYLCDGLGMWGNLGERVFDKNKWEVADFDKELIEPHAQYIKGGMDYGWTDPNTLEICAISSCGKYLYIYDEYYESRKTAADLEVECVNAKKYTIVGDRADQAKINHLLRKGYMISPCDKGAGSVRAGISTLQSFEKIYIHKNCLNAIREFKLYSWNPNKKNEPLDMHNHTIDAIRYALEEYTQYNSGQHYTP